MQTTNPQFTISIAEIPVTLDLTNCDRDLRTRLAEKYADFIVPTRAPYLINISVEPGAKFLPLAPTWQVRTSQQNGRLNFESHYEKGWFQRADGQAELVLREEGDPENFLRVIYAWMCLERNALLVHACGVIRDHAGYVFLGPSGDGKTTTASLSADYCVLSDDLVILKQDRDGWRVYGGPFRGDLPEAPRSNRNAPLRGIFTLVKDTDHHIEPLRSFESVARLAACVPFLMGQHDNAQRVTDLCVSINAAVPIRALHFRRDPGFWELIA